MNHKSTWLYKNAQMTEACTNGCIIAFNPTNSSLLRRQVEGISSDLQYDSRIYENVRTNRKILEAAKQAYLDGYESLFILTETEALTDIERLIESNFDFDTVQAFSEVVSSIKPMTKLAEAMYNAQPLREAPAAAPVSPRPVATPQAPIGSALLLVAALNVDPPTKGTAQLLQEILDLKNNAASLVAQYLPKFTTWDKKTVHTRIYIRSPGTTNSFDAGYRVCLLADGGSFLGLYDASGVSPNKVNPPLVDAPGGLWIPGDRRSNPLTKIDNFTSNLNIGGKIIFAPSAQVADVQSEFKISSTVVPLTASVPDEARPDLIGLMSALSSEYSLKNLTAAVAKSPNTKPSSSTKITRADQFVLQLLQHTLITGGNPTGVEYAVTDKMAKGGKGYFEGIWSALPEGDKALLTDIGEGTGVGDVLSIVKTVKDVGKAATGLTGKDTQIAEKKKAFVEKLGFGVDEVMNDPRYKQIKAAMDL